MLEAALLVGIGQAVAQEDAGRSHLLEELNWIEVGRLVPDSTSTVLVPVGTVEPHGVVNNGADNTVPFELARRLAPRVNALVAPTIAYGVTVTLDEYPGALGVSATIFETYCYEALRSLADAGFRTIVVLNGHGPNGAPLRRAAERVFRETDARLLVTEWWTMTADLVQEVYGTEGGHAGNNETGAVLAVRPDLVHPERYRGPAMTTPRGEGWTAYPFPSSIVLYREGEGYPDFDPARARRFFDGVLARLQTVIEDVVRKWEAAGL
ncbi:MAG: creatininase family protein [Gemmatimonadales bacterium]